jgi:hypothetical protein
MNENMFFIVGLVIMTVIWIAIQLADANEKINHAISRVRR